MEIDQLVESFAFRFAASGVDNAKRVAEELVAHVFDCRPLEIYTDAIPQNTTTAEKLRIIHRIEPLAERIEQGEPLQYVVGHVDFWGLQIKCDQRALIPRPETELLVEEVLASSVWTRQPSVVVDVGTGTGCIALTLAAQRPDAEFKAVDISADALELARENAHINGLDDRIEWMQNDLLSGFPEGNVGAVVANLPYIASADWKTLDPSVREHEPQRALDSGPDGLELIQTLAQQARTVLEPGGMLFLEFGWDQGESVRQCLNGLGYDDVRIKHDLAGHDRIAMAINP